MKHRFLLGLLLACGIVRAEPPPCIPVVKGVMAEYPARAVYGTLGRHFYWWCAAEPTKYYGFSCLHNGGCNEALWGTVLVSLNASTDKAKAVDAAWAKNVTLDLSNDKSGLAAERLAIFQTNKAEWMVKIPEVWKVKSNGFLSTRPSINLATGKDGPRAPTGALCLPDKPQGAKSGVDIRAQWVGGPDGVVTICQKQ